MPHRRLVFLQDISDIRFLRGRHGTVQRCLGPISRRGAVNNQSNQSKTLEDGMWEQILEEAGQDFGARGKFPRTQKSLFDHCHGLVADRGYRVNFDRVETYPWHRSTRGAEYI